MIIPMRPLRCRSPLPAAIAAGWLALGGVAQGASSHDQVLRRDAASQAPLAEPPRALFRGTLSRDADRLLLAPCGGGPDRAEALLVVATEGVAFEAELAPKICRDTMADAVFGFTATVRLARPEPVREFEGCAFLGSESLPGER